MEQELAAMKSEIESAHQNSSVVDASASTQHRQPNDEQLHQELHAAHIRADDLSISLMSTQSALNSAQTELASAKAQVTQLEQSVTGQAAHDGQAYSNGVSQLPSGRRQASSHLPSSHLPSGAGSAGSGSLPDDTAQLLQVECFRHCCAIHLIAEAGLCAAMLGASPHDSFHNSCFLVVV